MKMLVRGIEVDVAELDVKLEGDSAESLFEQELNLTERIGLDLCQRSQVFRGRSMRPEKENAKLSMFVTYRDLRMCG